ncbi:MAG: 7-cyano-7-deazaguanine synthase QueC [Thermodesulfobacteriota bacterium]
MSNPKKAIVLLSGGLDSATTLAVAMDQGYQCHSLSFDYGQRHRHELAAAGRIAEEAGSFHHVVTIDLRAAGGSALTGSVAVPKNGGGGQIPVTYVPARNTIFLAHALGWAEVLAIGDIFIGVNAVDYSGYPDCRPEFIAAFETMANLATKAAVEKTLRIRIRTPLIHMSKKEIIQKGISLGVDYGKTLSCYDPMPGGFACGACDSCRLRKKGFKEAGIADPAVYIPEKP